MSEIERVLTQISLFHQAFNKALKGNRDRSEWLAEAENAIRSVDAMLLEPGVRAEVDSLLHDLNVELQRAGAPVLDLEPHSDKLALFLKSEAKLHHFVDIRKADYERVVSLVRPFLPSGNVIEFPRTSDEFRRIFVHRATQFITDAKGTVVLPRKEKSRNKTMLYEEVWKYSLGTLMTVSNMFWAFKQPSLVAGGVATTSITYGARLFGLSARKPPKGEGKSRNRTDREDTGS